MLLSRIFTVFAAGLMVTAFALMVLPDDGTTLVRGLAQMAQDAPEKLQQGVVRTLGATIWLKLFVPVLLRPVWMLPFFLGLVCVGGAVTTLPPAESPRRTGRRL